ncbi:MAG: class I SAM-dependent methyltransferase [Anaerolineae bacterium]|nr:class I SAM-dependent methyltransferase [Anaerolineae bacterium]
MFHEIPKPVRDRMKALEALDAKDRQDGTTQLKRLRQIPPESGKFIALMAAGVPKGAMLEIGTSAGYSALWLSLACKLRGDSLVTFELLHEKADLAAQTFKKAKIEEQVELVRGDARGHVGEYEKIAFCFLDAEKEMYAEFYDLVVPNLVSGGLLIADNAINHQEKLQELLDAAEADERVDVMVVPVGNGLLVCRKL